MLTLIDCMFTCSGKFSSSISSLWNACILFQIGGTKYARIGVLFNVHDDATLPSLLFMEVFKITVSSYGLVEFLIFANPPSSHAMLSYNLSYLPCSHRKGVLQFIDQLCSFYEKEYMLSSGVTESYQALIDKVLLLADANGLPSKGYESACSGFSAENFRGYLNKVCSSSSGVLFTDNYVISFLFSQISSFHIVVS